eukprot:gb/GECG01007959.1/.p1 GENE.gb/GECG01007959.1/~~gb/GECG01007959.1/.p1  ORF type:complete len:462 (+),score=48.85 gb/GECG01007959.1/:1-1386(+)
MPQLDHWSALGRENIAKLIRVWVEEGIDKPREHVDQKIKERDSALYKYCGGFLLSVTAGNWKHKLRNELEQKGISLEGEKVDIHTARSIYQNVFPTGKRMREKEVDYFTCLNSEETGPTRKLKAHDPLSDGCKLLGEVYIVRILEKLQRHKVPPELLLDTRKIRTALTRIQHSVWCPKDEPPPREILNPDENIDLLCQPVVSSNGSVVVSQVIFGGNIDASERAEAIWQDKSHMKNHMRLVTKSGQMKPQVNKHTFRQLLSAINEYINHQIQTKFPGATAGVLILEGSSSASSYMLKLLDEFPRIQPVFVPPNMSAQLQPLCNGFIEAFQSASSMERAHYDINITKSAPSNASKAEIWSHSKARWKRPVVEKHALNVRLRNVLESMRAETIRNSWVEVMMKLFPDYQIDNPTGFHNADDSNTDVNEDPWKKYLRAARDWSELYNPSESESRVFGSVSVHIL